LDLLTGRVEACEHFTKSLILDALSSFRKGEWIALVRGRSLADAA
jgi:hypothetical protein